MSDAQRPGESPDNPKPAAGEPRQAMSGGGSLVQAGSPQGGSRSGAEPIAPAQGGGRTNEPGVGVSPEEQSFASPDGSALGTGPEAAQEAVNNTGAPDPLGEDAELERGAGGDDVDAASG